MSHDAVTCDVDRNVWNEAKIIDRDPHWYTGRAKEAIEIRLHRNNINRGSKVEIPEAYMPTIRKHNKRRAVRQRTTTTSVGGQSIII